MAACGRYCKLGANLLRNDVLKPNIDVLSRVASVHTDARRNKATAVALENHDAVKETHTRVAVAADPCYDRIDLSFENAQEAFKSKTNSEILRALLVFNMTSIKPIVTHNKKLMKLSRKILGANLFRRLMKGTFYGQFVAGEDEIRIRPTIARNGQYGVKSILDYSVEKDISKEEAQKKEMESCESDAQTAEMAESADGGRYRAHNEFGDRRENVIGARTYFYSDEANCDANMENFIKGIDAVSGATNATGFAAIKLTALGRPQFLLQLSEVLSRVRQFFDILDHDQSGRISRKNFEGYLKSTQIAREERKRWYTIMDADQDGEIDLLDWHNLLEVNISLAKLLRMPNVQTGMTELIGLTKEEEDQMRNMLIRIDTILKHSRDKDVRIMVDAEQTYFQMAINRLTMEMMRKFNKEKALVFNTYQCYLKDAHSNIVTDLLLSEKENFFFGAKLVRGAYMEQERKRAQALGYDDPINPNFEATTTMYLKVLDEVLANIQRREKGKIAVMIASHNEDTVRTTVEMMKKYNIRADDKVLCFGQLLGMCDQVSFSLGQAGYSVYKYVPYGPVEEVIPYLSRRAIENKGILGKVKKEKRMLRSELFRRLKNGQFFYKPPQPDVVMPGQT